MKEIFVSHVEEDQDIAVQIATGLEAAGFTTWYYERDNLPIIPYPVQIANAIEGCKAVLLLLSTKSLAANEVLKEVEGAYSKKKVLIPVLYDASYDELNKNTYLKQMLGLSSAIKVPKGGITTQFIEKLVAGLIGVGIVPQNEAPIELNAVQEIPPSKLTPEQKQKILVQSPAMIATVYEKILAAEAAPEQALQYCQSLEELSGVLARYVGMLALAAYRQESALPGKDLPALEQLLPRLRTAGLSGWAAFLASASEQFVNTEQQPIGRLLETCRDNLPDESPLALAITRMSDWVKPSVPVKNNINGFFTLLGAYTGWADKNPNGLPQKQRAADLRYALDALLVDELAFLFDETALICLENSGEQPRYFLAAGTKLAPGNEPVRLPKALEAGEVLLCRREKSGLEPVLSLYPLLVCQKCKSCGQVVLFVLDAARNGVGEMYSPNCSHRLELAEGIEPAGSLETFFSLEKYRETVEIPIPANCATYVTALRQVMSKSEQEEIGADERQKLNFLLSVSQISEELAARLETQVRKQLEAERKARQEAERKAREEAERLARLEAERKAQEEEEQRRIQEEEERAAGEAAEAEERVRAGAQEEPRMVLLEVPPERRDLVLCWQQPLAAPATYVALFDAPLSVLCADEKGSLSIYSADGRPLYQDRFEDRFYRLVSMGDLVIAGSWKGQLYGFNRHELLWQVGVNSPISALAVSKSKQLISAGTWDGPVAVYKAGDGQMSWFSVMDDGVSATAIAESGWVAAGTYTGQLAVFDPDGHKAWQRQLPAGISQLAFCGRGKELVVATRDHLITCFELESQEIAWEYPLEYPLQHFALSLNERRLAVASRDGHALIYQIHDGLSLRASYDLAGLAELHALPVTNDGRFLLGISNQEGLAFIDSHEPQPVSMVTAGASCAAISADGWAATGSSEALSLYRLARPELRLSLVPVAEMHKGRFTRVKIELKNTGERPAREIRVELEGPVECKPISLPAELLPGQAVLVENISVQPKEEGAIPVCARLWCVDDLAIQHEQQEDLVLDVAPGK